MRRLLDPQHRADTGMALPVVTMLGLILMAMVAVGLSTATSGLRLASTDQDETAAYDAAYAGVQDYLTRVNADATFVNAGTTSAAFSAGSTFSSLPTDNPAFDLGTAGRWATVPTETLAPATCPGPSTPCFRYEVDNRDFTASGVVRIRATGRVDQSTKSVVVSLKRQGFVNFLYFTDYETQDPVFSGNTACEAYAWANPPRSTGCAAIQFAASDTLAGPVHSNDTIVICGATFKAAVTTANPNTPVVVKPSGCSAGSYLGGDPAKVSYIGMPETNAAMSAQTRSNLVSTTGCLYTGPTVVKYLGDGKMTVWSPWTKFTNVDDSKGTGSNPGKCGSPGTAAGQLGNASGATITELDANLLYVQGVPAVADPNASATTSFPAGVTCVGTDGSTPVVDGTAGVGWKFGPWSFPLTGEAAPSGWDGSAGIAAWNPAVWSNSPAAYGCRKGDLFVKGTYTTQTTAASANYVYVIGDVLAQDKSRDLLGLVGNNAVMIWNPVTAGKASLVYNADGTTIDKNREVDAALLSVAHTFGVQNYDVSPNRGTLTMYGSIAQKFRGPVATSSGGAVGTGYAKDYQYNPLLAKISPPYFLAPATTNFVSRLFASVKPAYDAAGNAR